MSEFEKCSICGKGNLLPMSYMRCDTCDSELAGARELRINKRLVHDADTISLKNEIERLTQQLEEAKRDAEKLQKIKNFADEQANNEALWFQAGTAPEAYLQQEITRILTTIGSMPNE